MWFTPNLSRKNNGRKSYPGSIATPLPSHHKKYPPPTLPIRPSLPKFATTGYRGVEEFHLLSTLKEFSGVLVDLKPSRSFFSFSSLLFIISLRLKSSFFSSSESRDSYSLVTSAGSGTSFLDFFSNANDSIPRKRAGFILNPSLRVLYAGRVFAIPRE